MSTSTTPLQAVSSFEQVLELWPTTTLADFKLSLVYRVAHLHFSTWGGEQELKLRTKVSEFCSKAIGEAYELLLVNPPRKHYEDETAAVVDWFAAAMRETAECLHWYYGRHDSLTRDQRKPFHIIEANTLDILADERTLGFYTPKGKAEKALNDFLFPCGNHGGKSTSSWYLAVAQFGNLAYFYDETWNRNGRHDPKCLAALLVVLRRHLMREGKPWPKTLSELAEVTENSPLFTVFVNFLVWQGKLDGYYLLDSEPKK